MMPCFIIYLDDRKERKLIIVVHILFLFKFFFRVFLNAYTLGYISNLLLSLMCELGFIEALLYVTLKTRAIFISVIVLLMFRWLYKYNKLVLL